MRKKTILSILLFVLLFTLACGASSNPIDKYVNEYGGNPDIYSKILSMTDCAGLQKEFDQAEANLQAPGTEQYKWGLGYMKASDDRMREIGCYK